METETLTKISALIFSIHLQTQQLCKVSSPSNYRRKSYHRLRSLQPLFMKLAKSHISAQFLVRVYVLGWYTYFETPQVLFSIVFEKRGSKFWEFMNDIHEAGAVEVSGRLVRSFEKTSTRQLLLWPRFKKYKTLTVNCKIFGATKIRVVGLLPLALRGTF